MKSLKPTWKLSKKQILNNFSFLQSQFGFPKFKKKWIRDEYYITTRKDNIEFSTLIYQFSWCSPEITIIDHKEPIVFKTKFTPENYYTLDELDESGKLKEIAEKSRDYIPLYIKKCADLLKLKPNILNGITTDFKRV